MRMKSLWKAQKNVCLINEIGVAKYSLAVDT